MDPGVADTADEGSNDERTGAGKTFLLLVADEGWNRSS